MSSSFSFDTNTTVIRDTQIPSTEIPLILLHLLDEFYYGGGLSPQDMRDFMESKLRESRFERSVVRAWCLQAHQWADRKPERCKQLLGEYFQVQAVA